MTDPIEKIFEEVAKSAYVGPTDPYDTDEYQAFVDSMVPYCHCARNRPCDGVLAGGICDDVQEDEWESVFDEEDEV